MKVKELIELLGQCGPDDEVKAFDPNSGQIESVTGMVYAGADRIIELCTDDPN